MVSNEVDPGAPEAHQNLVQVFRVGDCDRLSVMGKDIKEPDAGSHSRLLETCLRARSLAECCEDVRAIKRVTRLGERMPPP